MQTLFENQNFYEHNFTGLDGKYKITKDAYKIKTNELNLYGGKYTTLLDARKKRLKSRQSIKKSSRILVYYAAQTIKFILFFVKACAAIA